MAGNHPKLSHSQLIFRAPNARQSTQSHKVFVSDIPPDIGGNDIISLVEQSHRVSEFRLITEHGNPELHRGYGFASFSTHHDAAEVVKIYNASHVGARTSKLDFKMSDSNTKLLLEVPKSRAKSEISDIFNSHASGGVQAVFLPKAYDNPRNNREYCVVTYKTKDIAVAEKTSLSLARLPQLQRDVNPKWADPTDEDMPEQVNLGLRNMGASGARTGHPNVPRQVPPRAPSSSRSGFSSRNHSPLYGLTPGSNEWLQVARTMRCNRNFEKPGQPCHRRDCAFSHR